MKFEFKKSKYPIFKIAFWILIFCSLLMIVMISKFGAYRLGVEGFTKTLEPISMNITFKRNVNEQIFVCFNDFCKAPSANSIVSQKANFNYISSARFNSSDENFYNQKISKIFFAYPQDMKNPQNKIEKIDLYVGEKAYHYDFADVQKMDKKIVPIVLTGKNEKTNYIAYSFDAPNYIGIMGHLSNLILSLFFNFKYFLIPYSWLAIALLIFLFNKDAFKIDFKKKALYLSICSLVILIIFSIAFIFGKKIKNDSYLDFIAYDIQNISKDVDIHIFSKQKENYYRKYFKNNSEMLNRNIIWHNVEKPISKIEKEIYVKNNKNAILYLSSQVADMSILGISNPRSKMYNLNSIIVASITYN